MKYQSEQGKNHGKFADAGRFSFLARGRIIQNSVSAPKEDNRRQPQNIKCQISQKPLMDHTHNFKLKLI